jgi:DNA polymerase
MTEAANRLNSAAARTALRWLIDMGADEVVGERPFVFSDQALQADAIPQIPTPATAPARPPTTETAPPDLKRLADRAAASETAIADAAAVAQACSSLGEIEAALGNFVACPLQRTATKLVYCDGLASPRVLLIGEAPGRDEDEQGKPFVGLSGQLLDRMLNAVGLSRRCDERAAGVLITNLIFWRPPGNRKPTEAETLMCLPFVLRTIALAAPDFVVCLGATPTQRLLGTTEGILKLRGRWKTFQGVPLLATLHPAYLLRQPAQKRLAWRDLLSLKRRLDSAIA